MIQCDSIIAAAVVAFNADGNMNALVPGGIWHRRAPSEEQGLTRPYAIAQAVAAADKEYNSGGSCIQRFFLTVTIYGDEKTSTTGKIASYLSDWDLNRSLFATVPAQILNVFPSNEDLDIDAQEKEGQDVIVASKQWTLVLHYNMKTVPSN